MSRGWQRPSGWPISRPWFTNHGRQPPTTTASGTVPSSRSGRYPGPVLDLDNLDLGDIADALADQFGGYEHLMLIDPQTGETVHWSADTGIDGNTPIDLDELLEERELIGIRPLPSWVWYQDMADFADSISDEQAGRRLERAIRGKRAFRRFKDELHEEYPDLLPVWYEFHDARAMRRAVEWLAEQSLIDDAAADRYVASHPGPDLP